MRKARPAPAGVRSRRSRGAGRSPRCPRTAGIRGRHLRQATPAGKRQPRTHQPAAAAIRPARDQDAGPRPDRYNPPGREAPRPPSSPSPSLASSLKPKPCPIRSTIALPVPFPLLSVALLSPNVPASPSNKPPCHRLIYPSTPPFPTSSLWPPNHQLSEQLRDPSTQALIPPELSSPWYAVEPPPCSPQPMPLRPVLSLAIHTCANTLPSFPSFITSANPFPSLSFSPSLPSLTLSLPVTKRRACHPPPSPPPTPTTPWPVPPACRESNRQKRKKQEREGEKKKKRPDVSRSVAHQIPLPNANAAAAQCNREIKTKIKTRMQRCTNGAPAQTPQTRLRFRLTTPINHRPTANTLPKPSFFLIPPSGPVRHRPWLGKQYSIRLPKQPTACSFKPDPSSGSHHAAPLPATTTSDKALLPPQLPVASSRVGPTCGPP